MRSPVRGRLAAGLLLLLSRAPAAETLAVQPSPYIEPLPGVAAFAKAHAISVNGIGLAPTRTTASPDDTVVALITLFDGPQYRQWLLQVTVVPATAEDQKKRARPMTIFTSSGGEFRFDGALVALDLHLVGPFASFQPGKPTDARARRLVNADFLGLGFDRASGALQRLVSANRNHGGDPIGLDFSSKPFAQELIARTKPRVAELKLDPYDERAMVSVTPALIAFFDLAQKTPGLKDILAEMLDKSSLAWSALTHGGKLEPSFEIDSNGVEIFDAAKWGSDLAPAFRFPFVVALNKKPALATQFIVTAAHPPLLTCAGILGVLVEPPGGKKKLLVIRVLAATPGKSPISPQ